MLSNLLAQIDPEAEIQFLDFDSPYLERLRQLSDEGNYADIEQLGIEMAQEGLLDVRIIIVGMYAQTQENPLLGLGRVIEDLEILFGEAWAFIGPAEKKNKYAKGSLAWILKQIRVDLDSNKVDESELWQTWISGELSREELGHFLEMIDDVKRQMLAVLEDESDSALLALNDLLKWLKELLQLIPEALNEEDTASNSDDGEAVGFASFGADQNGTFNALNTPDAPLLQGSYHVQVLIKKMELFRHVVQKGDFLKAAIVASDMNDELAQFDPKKYFPSLFSDYLFVMAGEANRIADLMDMRDTPQWQVLTELYRIDLAKFAKVKTEH